MSEGGAKSAAAGGTADSEAVVGGNNQKKDRASPSLSPFLSAGNRGGREGEKRERRKEATMEGGRVLSTKQQLFPRLKAAEGERERGGP